VPVQTEMRGRPADAGNAVRITTVPQTLMFPVSQAAHLRPPGIDVRAITSPGADLERFGWKERILCVSHSIAALSRADELVREKKLGALPAGSDDSVNGPERFRSPSLEKRAARQDSGIARGARVIGFVVRLVRDKGLDEFGRAWRSLRRAIPDLVLLPAGETESHEPLPEGTASQLRSDPRVWRLRCYVGRLHTLRRPAR